MFMKGEAIMDKALEIKGLNSRVGDFQLKDITFSVEKGTIMGLIGKNGAGKTTLIKTIMQNLPISCGDVLFDGKTLNGSEQIVRKKVGIVHDNTIYPLSMKPKNIIKMFAPFYDNFCITKFNELMDRFDLDPNKKLYNYSKGMQMKFSVVMALSFDPQLIILDEPTAGLDPVARADVLDLLLEQMQNEEKSVLFSTHITSDLEKIADFITLLDNGRITFTESKDDLLDKYALVSVEKSVMNDDDITKLLSGVKVSSFGYTGLTRNKDTLSKIEGIKVARPTIEDIMIYDTGRGGTDV